MSIATKIGAGIVPLLMLLGCASPPELASVSAVSAPENTLFRNVSLFDGVTMRAHQDVLVTGREVAAVSDTGELETSPDTMEVAGAGLTLLPGLIDSHTHLVSAGEKHPPAPDPMAIGEAFLYAGVTTILVTAGFDEVVSFRNQLREGVELGPTVLWGGPGLSAPGGHPIPLLRSMLAWPLSWVVTRGVPTAADGKEARERVEEIIVEYEPDFVKIIYDDLPPGSSHLSRDALRAAVTAAKANGVRPIVHTTTPEDTIEAVDAGAALLVHVPQRGVLSDDDVQRLVAAGVPFVTTVRLPSASYELAADGPIALETEMYHPSLLQPWLENPRWELSGFSEEIDRRHDEVAAETEGMPAPGFPTPKLQRPPCGDERARGLPRPHAGARISFLFVGISPTPGARAGSFPGASLHREMRLLVRLGMSPVDVLRAVTSEPGAFLDPTGRIGRVSPGSRADLLLVRGNPSEDINALAAIEAVFVGGVRLERHGLH